MNGQFDLVTVIALIIAVAAVLKLRSVLGHRSDDDDQRVERLKTRERDRNPRPAVEGASADVITMPRRDGDALQPAATAEAPGSGSVEARIRTYPVSDPAVTQGLLDIAKLDPALDPADFLNGAGRAYELIVSAFAEGNRRALKDLLSKDVYDGFAAAIGERESREEKIEQQFVGIKKSDIVEAEVRNGIASVTVRFLSELISATYDKTGALIAGDAQRIRDVTDLWTFSRDVSTAKARGNPNWKLVATQAPT